MKTARWWDGLWGAWVIAALVVSVFDKGDALIPLAATFFLLELPGVRNRADAYLPLTLELQARSPGWLTFVLLGAGMWRLSTWIHPLAVFILASWLIWHFIQTYAEKSHEAVSADGSTTEARL